LEDSKLKDGYLVDMGIGVLTGGLGGIAVGIYIVCFINSIIKNVAILYEYYFCFYDAVLVSCFAF
jgi:ABC-type lipoprotein release transport system permease subunit